MADQPAKPKPVALKPITARPDLASIGGLVLSVGGIREGLRLEGGKIRDVAQITAAGGMPAHVAVVVMGRNRLSGRWRSRGSVRLAAGARRLGDARPAGGSARDRNGLRQ